MDLVMEYYNNYLMEQQGMEDLSPEAQQYMQNLVDKGQRLGKNIKFGVYAGGTALLARAAWALYKHWKDKKDLAKNTREKQYAEIQMNKAKLKAQKLSGKQKAPRNIQSVRKENQLIKDVEDNILLNEEMNSLQFAEEVLTKGIKKLKSKPYESLTQIEKDTLRNAEFNLRNLGTLSPEQRDAAAKNLGRLGKGVQYAGYGVAAGGAAVLAYNAWKIYKQWKQRRDMARNNQEKQRAELEMIKAKVKAQKLSGKQKAPRNIK